MSSFTILLFTILLLYYSTILVDEYFDATVREVFDNENIYPNVIVFSKTKDGERFIFKQESDDVNVTPLFHCSRHNYWYSYVPFDKIQILKHVKLSIISFCRWFGLPNINMNNLKKWQDENQMLLRFKKIDVTKERRWQIRSGGPGNYEPEWLPKITFNLGIDENNFFYLFDSKEATKCGKTKCLYKSWRVDKIEQHRTQCSDTTDVKSKQVFYGKRENQFEKYSIPENFFQNPEFKFAVFDLETTETFSDDAEAKLKILSIGLYSNIDNKQYYFERKSSSFEDGQQLVNDFMEKLQELADEYQSSLPKEIQLEIYRLKDQVLQLSTVNSKDSKLVKQ